MHAPLEGIRILDLGWIIAGPLATRLLADFGADVIKVESSLRIDTARANRIPLFGVLPGNANSDPDAGGYFQDVNSGKRSCTLNLAQPQGRDLLRRLVQVSDALLCNLGGDQLERWGIGYQTARALNPGFIVLNMPTMASSGPRARWRAFGDMIAGAAGLKAVSGNPEDGPLSFGHQYADFAGNPFHGAIALLAALHHRDRTGEGQFIEVSQYESTIALLGAAVLQQSAGDPPRPSGNREAQAAPHNIYRCHGDDSWCAIAIYNDDQWLALSELDGLDGLHRPAFATAAGRKQHEAEIDAVIERWTVGWDRQELAAFLQQCGVPAGPYQEIGEMVVDDPVLGLAHFHRLEHPVEREFLIHGSPVQSLHNPAVVRRGPLLGEDTFAVLHDLLGLDDEAIARFAEQGAIA